MGILERVSMIVKSNVNDILDKAENPERQLNYFIVEMADSIKEAEVSTQSAMAQAKLLQLQSEEATRKGLDWEQKAERALKANREDLAREALRMKGQADADAAQLKTQYEAQMVLQKELRENLVLLRQKYEDVQRNKVNLLARYGMAKINNQIYGEKDPATGLSDSAMSRMERKIMAGEAYNEMAGAEIKAAQTEAEINNLPGGSDELDSELAALKAKMGMGKKPEEGSDKQS